MKEQDKTASYLISASTRDCLAAAIRGNIKNAVEATVGMYELDANERRELIDLLKNYAKKLKENIEELK